MIYKYLKCFVFVALLLITSIVLQAQRAPMKYNKVDHADVRMTTYEKDTTAKAVVLGDYGVIEIRYDREHGFRSHFTRHLRMKILDKDALDEADFKIRLYGKSFSGEDMTSLKGMTFTPENGKIVKTKLKRKNAYEEEISDNVRSMNFSLPNVKEGSVFDLEYTVASPFLYTLPVWFFQNRYPTEFSELRLYIPEYFFYKTLMQGFLTLTEHNQNTRLTTTDFDYQENISILRMENAPAFKTEPHMNAIVNYLSKIEHELVGFRSPFGGGQDFSSTWPKLTEQLLDSKSFGKVFDKTDYMSEAAAKIKSEFEDEHERMVAAYRYIQNEMNWDKSTGYYASTNMKKIWEKREGDAADINFLLMALLKELDIDVDPVILSTRAHGMLNPSQIMLNGFNYVIACANINGEKVLLDATDKDVPYYLLPERCINGKGRVVKANGGEWVDLEAFGDNLAHTKSEIVLKPCGSVKAQLVREFENYNRLRLVKKYKTFDSDDEYMDDFESVKSGMELNSFELANKEDWSQPLIANYQFDIPEPAATQRDILYINPLLIDQMESNPFRSEDRLFPVDFVFPNKRVFDITIQIPEGYEIEEMPENAKFRISRSGNAANYSSTYQMNGDNTIEVKINFAINKSLFIPDEYKHLREFYAKVVEEQAKMIVLKKIS